MLAIMRVRVLGDAFISSVHNEGQRIEVRNQDIRVVELQEQEFQDRKYLYEVGTPFVLRRQTCPVFEAEESFENKRGLVDLDDLIVGEEYFVQVRVSLGDDVAYLWGMYGSEEAYKEAEIATYASASV